MLEDVVIEPMSEEFIVWRCLHGGPVSRDTIDRFPPENALLWERCRNRNVPLLKKLTRTYGACAILARDGGRVVGHLRFYPRAVYEMAGAGSLCLQQDFPFGPKEGFAGSEFPALAQLKDKTLAVHCIMSGSPRQEENPYQRKGIGSRMVKTLIEWAAAHGWSSIEADCFEDLPVIYEITGSTGYPFWEKLGFMLTDRYPHPDLQDRDKFPEFIIALEEQAIAAGLLPESAKDQLVMRLNLKGSGKTGI